MPRLPGDQFSGGELPPPTEPVADKSVRVAWAADATAIGAIQARAWTASYAEALPGRLLAQVDAAEFAAAWRESLTRPPSARHRVLVALDHGTVVGFAATEPAEDPDSQPTDGEIAAFHVDPAAEQQGHGSRLIAAAVDTLRADGFTHAHLWVVVGDDRLRGFLEPAGWGPDGAHRTLELDDAGEGALRQVRLHTDLRPEPEPSTDTTD